MKRYQLLTVILLGLILLAVIGFGLAVLIEPPPPAPTLEPTLDFSDVTWPAIDP